MIRQQGNKYLVKLTAAKCFKLTCTQIAHMHVQKVGTWIFAIDYGDLGGKVN